MIRPLLLATLAAPALLVGGCMGTQNRGVESVHQPVVDRTSYALDLATRGGGLAPGEDGRLGAWMDGMRLGYGDHVAVDDPDYGAPTAHQQVAGVVARYGLLLSTDAPVTSAPVAPGVIRVVVTRMRAGVPGCPDWTRDASHEFDSNTSSDYGCAVNQNLAAMVAHPGDLIEGVQGDGVIDPATTTRAIQAYRKQAPTGANGLPGGVTSVSVTGGR